jgi:MOSC domain-containing protein YiiM
MKVTGIFCYAERRKPGVPLKDAQLFESKGLEGDIHFGSGDRQLAIADTHALDREPADVPRGLCFDKFKANLFIEGLSMLPIKVGQIVSIGDAEIEITQTKDCYPEDCARFAAMAGGGCPAREGCAFAKVVKSGRISVD